MQGQGPAGQESALSLFGIFIHGMESAFMFNHDYDSSIEIPAGSAYAETLEIVWRVQYAIITAIIGFMLLWRIFGLKENAHFQKRSRGEYSCLVSGNPAIQSSSTWPSAVCRVSFKKHCIRRRLQSEHGDVVISAMRANQVITGLCQ